jgi:hypothetical protein
VTMGEWRRCCSHAAHCVLQTARVLKVVYASPTLKLTREITLAQVPALCKS